MSVSDLFFCPKMRIFRKRMLKSYHFIKSLIDVRIFIGDTRKGIASMFTWNFQYISRSRLSEVFDQLTLDPQKGDILIRIHTAIHFGDEAVELAHFIKEKVPQAHIFGTSTSGVINMGHLANNQCIISVTQMEHGSINTKLISTLDDELKKSVSPENLFSKISETLIKDNTRFLLTFVTGRYSQVTDLIDRFNDTFPSIQMTGGTAIVPDLRIRRALERGFVFDENGYTNNGIILAAFNGEDLECQTSFVSGAEVVGNEHTIDDSFGNDILTIGGMDAPREYYDRLGGVLEKRKDLAYLFPYVFSDKENTPLLVQYYEQESLNEMYPKDNEDYREFYESHPDIDANVKRPRLVANQRIKEGSRIKRAFIHGNKIVYDNQRMFNRISSFEKAQTLFGYSCMTRPLIYSNCAKWEISVYENTNICGCLTGGEIFYNGKKNVYGNSCFVVSVLGEKPEIQAYNPYVFTHTVTLESDNEELMDYLMTMEEVWDDKDEEIKQFVHECASKLLYTSDTGIMNVAAMNMDIKYKGYDRICMISVVDVESMSSVFSRELIELTNKNYVKKCKKAAEAKGYHIYCENNWRIAIGARSYMVDFGEFTKDMEILQQELFSANDEFIAIIPLFCVIDNCTLENLTPIYNRARITMMQKNIQFFACDAQSSNLDEESIKDRYHMVKVIKYAIANDKVIPQYQGIFCNSRRNIEHYEALMRLMDENGKLYYPNSFLDVARSYGILYDMISKMMLKKVFEHFRGLKDKGVSINLGIRDIRNREITDYIYDFLGTTPYPENFMFEILENEDIDDYGAIVTFVDNVHNLGGKIALDDFGSGFSNLQHVMSIHFDYLKIDGSIVRRCVDSKEAENLIALISGWKKLSDREINIIAEFVENEDIQDKMENYEIDYSQGYLFSKPSANIFD